MPPGSRAGPYQSAGPLIRYLAHFDYKYVVESRRVPDVPPGHRLAGVGTACPKNPLCHRDWKRN